MQENTRCFIGHRTINETEELKRKLQKAIENLIIDNGVDTFLFGSGSRFNSLCLEIVTNIKQIHQHIKRIYVRAEFPYINESYTAYLLKSYDDTYFPEKIINAGKAVYVERNREMIDKSRFCIFYYDESNKSNSRKSGTEIALNYAQYKNKEIIIF